MPQLATLLLGFEGPVVYLLVFGILLACGFGIPIPEDITLIAAGVLSYYEAADVWGMIAVGFAGVMMGDSCMFMLGSRFGLSIAKKPFVARFLPDERLNKVRDTLHTKGPKILFAARFMPGLRSPLFFTAGAMKIPFRVFFFYDGLAALISVPAIIYPVFYFGHEMEHIIGVIKQANQGIVAFLVVMLGIYVGKKWLAKRKVGAEALPAASVTQKLDSDAA